MIEPTRVHLVNRHNERRMRIAIVGKVTQTVFGLNNTIQEHPDEAAAAAAFEKMMRTAASQGWQPDPDRSPNPELLAPGTVLTEDDAWIRGTETWRELFTGELQGVALSLSDLPPLAEDDVRAIREGLQRTMPDELRILGSARVLLDDLEATFPTVKRLTLDDPRESVSRNSRFDHGDLRTIGAVFPGLASLRVVGQMQPSSASLPHLERLELIGDPLPLTLVDQLSTCELPMLRELKLALCWETRAAKGHQDSLENLFRGLGRQLTHVTVGGTRPETVLARVAEAAPPNLRELVLADDPGDADATLHVLRVHAKYFGERTVQMPLSIFGEEVKEEMARHAFVAPLERRNVFA